MDQPLNDFFANTQREGSVAAQTLLIAKLATLSPENPSLWQQVANRMIQAGFAANASEVLKSAIRRFPRAHELLYLRGNAQRLNAQPIEAEADFREVLRVAPQHGDAALSLAYMLRELGRMCAAGEVIVASLRARGERLDDTLSALIFLRECGAHERAHAIAQAGLTHWPDNADIAALAAEFALAIGEFVVARRCLHDTLDRAPDKSASWLRLAYCQRFNRRDDCDFVRMEHAWNSRKLDPQSRLCAGFALGKALDDLGDYAQAAAVLRDANALKSATVRWCAADWNQFVDERLSARQLPPIDVATDFAPIFIVGLPRTGTTLAATILSRNKFLRERGELNWISAMFAHLVAQNKLHDRTALAAIAQLICAQMRRDDAPARWYLDKNPLDFRYLDFICALFPHAKIIHCQRNPRDAALSLWMQHFAHDDMGFAYDFAAIAQFAQGHDRLMAHWRKSLNLPIFDLQYEALAADPSTALGELTQSLGVSAVAPMDNEVAPARAIVTASVWQARQPIYTSSIGRWKNYAAYLPELEELF